MYLAKIGKLQFSFSYLSQGFALLSTLVLWFIERKQKKENASEESDRLIPDPGTAVRYDSAMVA